MTIPAIAYLVVLFLAFGGCVAAKFYVGHEANL